MILNNRLFSDGHINSRLMNVRLIDDGLINGRFINFGLLSDGHINDRLKTEEILEWNSMTFKLRNI